MRVFPPPQHLHRGVTSCPSAELFIPSKHSVIDAAANQDSDHTVMLLQPTEAVSQILSGALLPHKTHSDDSVFCISLWIYFQFLRRIFVLFFSVLGQGWNVLSFNVLRQPVTTRTKLSPPHSTSHPHVLAHVTWMAPSIFILWIRFNYSRCCFWPEVHHKVSVWAFKEKRFGHPWSKASKTV